MWTHFCLFSRQILREIGVWGTSKEKISTMQVYRVVLHNDHFFEN